MKRKSMVILGVGTIFLVAGMVLIYFHIAPPVVPVMLIALGSSFVAVFFDLRSVTIRDEMVKRADVLSGYCTSVATLYFLFLCGIINFFFPLPVGVSGLLVAMMLFMSSVFVFTRLYFLKRGPVE